MGEGHYVFEDGREVDATKDERDSREVFEEKVEELHQRIAQQLEDENGEKNWKPPIIKAPHQPTDDEWARHRAIHAPYAPWCPHCVDGRVGRRQRPKQSRRSHIVLDADEGQEGPIKISMDHMYLHDRFGKHRDTQWNPPYLVVVVDHRYDRCWAYQVPSDGCQGDPHWAPTRFIQDWDIAGFKGLRIIFKMDQEPSMTSMQEAIQEARPTAIILVNSPVAESECNPVAENAIRRTQGKTIALRHHMEHGMKQKIPDGSPIMAWMSRWIAEFPSKYSMGDGGKSSYERIRGERCNNPLIPFVEVVLHLPMEVVHRNKGDRAKFQGAWLDTNERQKRQ